MELSLHNLKKTFSTLLADSNAPMHITQKLSHHSDIRTTLQYYIYKRLDSERQALSASRASIKHLAYQYSHLGYDMDTHKIKKSKTICFGLFY